MNTQSNVTQLDRHYYYRPCQFDGGKTLKCAGHGAELTEHLAFYLDHFAKGAPDQFLLPGVVVLRGYHGDKVDRQYALTNALVAKL